jgi:hypothetical protein
MDNRFAEGVGEQQAAQDNGDDEQDEPQRPARWVA